MIILSHGPIVGAQVRDSLRPTKIFYRSILHITLMGTGIILNISPLEQSLQVNLRSGVNEDFNSEIDDYLQYAPIAEMYIVPARKPAIN